MGKQKKISMRLTPRIIPNKTIWTIIIWVNQC